MLFENFSKHPKDTTRFGARNFFELPVWLKIVLHWENLPKNGMIDAPDWELWSEVSGVQPRGVQLKRIFRCSRFFVDRNEDTERGHENRLLAWIPPSEVAPRVPLALADKGVAAGSYVYLMYSVAGNGVSSFAKYVYYFLCPLVNIERVPPAQSFSFFFLFFFARSKSIASVS